MIDKLFVATKAFVVKDGKVLILKESSKYEDGSNTGRYDVPGGRVELGQRFDESLLREVREETCLEVKIGNPISVGEWRPVIRGESWQIVGIFFECHVSGGDVVLSQDHESFEWINPKEYKSYNLIENLNPVFEIYIQKNNT